MSTYKYTGTLTKCDGEWNWDRELLKSDIPNLHEMCDVWAELENPLEMSKKLIALPDGDYRIEVQGAVSFEHDSPNEYGDGGGEWIFEWAEDAITVVPYDNEPAA